MPKRPLFGCTRSMDNVETMPALKTTLICNATGGKLTEDLRYHAQVKY